jgi:hypothetical protein
LSQVQTNRGEQLVLCTLYTFVSVNQNMVSQGSLVTGVLLQGSHKVARVRKSPRTFFWLHQRRLCFRSYSLCFTRSGQSCQDRSHSCCLPLSASSQPASVLVLPLSVVATVPVSSSKPAVEIVSSSAPATKPQPVLGPTMS